MDHVVDTPMWLSHHHPEGYERCVVVAGRHVCRRCLAMYPVALGVAAVQLAGLVPGGVGDVLMWLTPVPVMIEWIGEHVAGRPYSPTRQVVTSVIAAVGLGIALGVHAETPFAGRAVLPMLLTVAVCLTAWVLGLRHAGPAADWEADFERAEIERRARLEQLLHRPDGQSGGQSGRQSDAA